MSKPAPPQSVPHPTHHAAADPARDRDRTDAPPRIAVVGWGLVTPLGDGAWPTFRALLAGRTLADRAANLPEDIAPLDLARALGCVAAVQGGRTDPAVLLAERAAREAATMAGLAAGTLSRVGLWLGTSKGAVAKLSNAMAAGRPIDEDSARCVALGPHAYLAEQLGRRLRAPVLSHHVAACSSGLVALDAARRSLMHGGAGVPPVSILQRRPGRPSHVSQVSHPFQTDSANDAPSPYALVVSADAAITPALLASYRRLGVLGTLTAADYNQRPLDERRQGFMLSEIGAAVLLKRLGPNEPLPAGAVELVETATASEAYDIIRSPDDMTSLAWLWRRITANRSIDVIHPHAPGTRDHDVAELDALLHTSSPAKASQPAAGHADRPDLYAVKGAIGHGLGASGLASLVVAAMSLRAGQLPPMPWLSEPMKRPDGGRLETSPGTRPCRRAGSHAVLAAGFGGHLAAAVLQGPQPVPASDREAMPQRPAAP